LSDDSIVITLKLGAEDAALLDKAARKHKVSRSKFIRDSLRKMEPKIKVTMKRGEYKPRSDAYSLASSVENGIDRMSKRLSKSSETTEDYFK